MRARLEHLTKNKTLLVGLAVAVLLGIVGSASAYAGMSKTVTLSVDGERQQVRTFAGSVGDVLAAYRADPRMGGAITFAMNAVVVEGMDCTLTTGMRGQASYAFA